MAKSENEYIVIEIGAALTSPTPSAKLMSYADQGWEVQQIFTAIQGVRQIKPLHSCGVNGRTLACIMRYLRPQEDTHTQAKITSIRWTTLTAPNSFPLEFQVSLANR
jgi:hypothetical protein